MAIGSPQWMYASGEDAFTIDQSLRFNDDDSAYLSTTLGTATHNDRLTFSCWVKRSAISENHKILTRYTDSDNRFYIGIASNDKIYIYQRNGGSLGFSYQTTQLFRDPSAWMHIVLAIDTGQGTPSDRVRLYVNGVEVTDFSTETDPTQDLDLIMQTATSTEIRLGQYDSSQYFDGYLAEVHFIDGQQLTPSSFGETGDYGEWKPIEYSGSYGTNGFYLDFADSSALGDDESGNTNDWTVNNLTASDQVVDSPTNNFATGNPLVKWGWDDNIGILTFSEGNLKVGAVGSSQIQAAKVPFTMAGKMYFETLILTQNYQVVGIGEELYGGQSGINDNSGNAVDGLNVYVNAGTESSTQRVNGTQTVTDMSSTTPINAGDIVQFAYDTDTGKAWFGVNNTWYGSGNPSTGANPVCTFPASTRSNMQPAGSDWQADNGWVWNFGQDSSFAGEKTAQGNQDGNSIGDFYYTPPTGYLALCTSNLPDVAVTPSEHFNTVLYTANAGTNVITGVGFQPDFSWFKIRNSSGGNVLFDAIRGVNSGLSSNQTAAEYIAAADKDLVSFDSDGFTLGAGEDWASVNQTNGSSIVAWNWKANGSGSSNTDGDIDSTVSVNADAGFSIVSYTGSGTGGDTVGHGLSKAPEMIIVKTRNDVEDWGVYHASNTSEPETDRLKLNSTVATADNAGFWNDVAPTSSLFTVGTANTTNWSTKTYIAYCFHSVDSYSSVGSYTGNGDADGTFVYTGFRPALVIIKPSSRTGNWFMSNSESSPNNVVDKVTLANSSAAEYTDPSADCKIDYLSNGFKPRTADDNTNESDETYIYIAFAETPFKYSNAR